jgi:hypothetical protein
MTPALKAPARARAEPHAIVFLVGTPPGEGALRSVSSASDLKAFRASELLQVGGAAPVAASVTTALTAAFIAVERIAALPPPTRLADAYVALCAEPSSPRGGVLGGSGALVRGGCAVGASGRRGSSGSTPRSRAGSSGGETPRRPTSFIDNLLQMMHSAPDEIVEWGHIVASSAAVLPTGASAHFARSNAKRAAWGGSTAALSRAAPRKKKSKKKRGGSVLSDDVAAWWAGDAIVVHHRKKFETEVRCVRAPRLLVRRRSSRPLRTRQRGASKRARRSPPCAHLTHSRALPPSPARAAAAASASASATPGPAEILQHR